MTIAEIMKRDRCSYLTAKAKLEDEASSSLERDGSAATCGATYIGGEPIRQSKCDRERGHLGWHVESATNDAWPPRDGDSAAKSPPNRKASNAGQ